MKIFFIKLNINKKSQKAKKQGLSVPSHSLGRPDGDSVDGLPKLSAWTPTGHPGPYTSFFVFQGIVWER